MGKFILCLTIGYITGLAGFIPAGIFTKLTGGLGRRFHGALMGFTGGLLIAFICFEMLARTFMYQNVYLIAVGLLIGVIVSALLENKILFFTQRLKNINRKQSVKSALMLIFGVAMHNIPEGMALGTMLAVSPVGGYKMAVIIAIHCFPEAIAINLPLIDSRTRWGKIILFAVLLALPMALGSGAGALISGISPLISVILLSIAGGVMIYITCGDILPESKEIWHGRISAIGAGIGFIVGVIVTSVV